VLIGHSGDDYSVVTNEDLTALTISDGFIIQGGETNRGGGIYNRNASPALRNLSIKDNRATWGGGIFNTDASSPEITDVEISNNIAEYSGGGILNVESSNPILTRVVIRANSVSAPPMADGVAGGGGTFYPGGGTLKLRDVTLTDTTATSDGAGIYLAERHGGAIYLHPASTTATIVNTVIGGNQAHFGGGIYNDGNFILLNTTVAANQAANGGGVYHAVEAAAIIENSIISRNDNFDGITADDVYNNGSGESVRTYAHSLVAGSGGSPAWNEIYGVDGGGNVDADPDFLSTDRTSADYLRLGACSPAIDGGSDERYENGDHDVVLDSDAAGHPRRFGSAIDMGAFERQALQSNWVAVPAAGTYGIGQKLMFEVTFSAPVSVIG